MWLNHVLPMQHVGAILYHDERDLRKIVFASVGELGPSMASVASRAVGGTLPMAYREPMTSISRVTGDGQQVDSRLR